jgi:hypothetical protein
MSPRTKLSEVCSVGVNVKALKREREKIVHISFKESIQGFVTVHHFLIHVFH